ncbi:hypothetical protein D3C87_432330 [compost metagenome]|jgi:hypothetical protein
MFKPVLVAVAAACVLVSGCSVTRYPVLPAWSADATRGMDCADLRREHDAALGTQRQIANLAAGGRAERPKLYSTARADADRAVQARLADIDAGLQAKACPA